MVNNYKVVENSKKNFDKYFKKFYSTKSFDKKFELAEFLAYLASYAHTGYYYSYELEKFFIECAQKYSTEICTDFQEKSFLHVVTNFYKRGGHSRVVEKWIKQAPDNEIHSVVLLNQQYNHDITEVLQENIKEKNGTLEIFDTRLSTIDRALELRKLASKYEYIVLHTHMEDATSLIAFGTEDFKRPIIFYNHADHMFWLGLSIIDALADIRPESFVTKEKRGVIKPYYVGVPIDYSQHCNLTKEKAREELNIEKNVRIVLTIGADYNFVNLPNKSYSNMLADFIKDKENTYIYVVGPSKQSKQWLEACKRSNNKIKLVGKVDYNTKYFKYIAASDFILDSWPMGGGTVMIDAVSNNRAVLSLDSTVGQFAYLTKSQAYCKSEEEFFEKFNRLLNDETFANDLLLELKQNLEKENSQESFVNNIRKMLNEMPKTHNISLPKSQNEKINFEDADLILNLIYNKQGNIFSKMYNYLKYLQYKYFKNNKHKMYKYKKLSI